jgi:uncharacterized RmlC-like cupin family protein
MSSPPALNSSTGQQGSEGYRQRPNTTGACGDVASCDRRHAVIVMESDAKNEATVSMSGRYGFHPDLRMASAEAVHSSLRTRVHHVKASELSSGTAQTEGMQRFSAISGGSVGSEKIWMGETYVLPETVSDNHHHGESETAIFVRSGKPEFVFHDGVEEVRIATAPGDYIFVPPYVPHREENPDRNNPAVIVIARSTQEAIVVNLPELYALSEHRSNAPSAQLRADG